MTELLVKFSVEDRAELAREIVGQLAPLLAGEVDSGGATWMTVKQTAVYLQTTDAAVRALVKRQRIPLHRAEGRILFDRSEFDAWIRGGECPQP